MMHSADIDMIVVHGSATKPDQDIGAAEIRKWHVEDNGWSDIGYHWVIKRDGTIEPGRPENVQGAHATAVNSHSLGICLVGGMDDFGGDDCNYTFAQYVSLDRLLRVTIDRHPTIKQVISHRDVDTKGKTCPVFDAGAFFEMPGKPVCPECGQEIN